MNAAHLLSYADRLKIAHNALKNKRKYSVEYYTETEVGFQVEFCDQFGNWSDEIISSQTLENFVNEFYSKVSDCETAGEHIQYEDTRSAYQYLAENTTQVITDYLNNRRG